MTYWHPVFSGTCSGINTYNVLNAENDVFCSGVLNPGQPPVPALNTYDSMNPQILNGDATGGYGWSYQWYKSGGCAALMSFGHQDSFGPFPGPR